MIRALIVSAALICAPLTAQADVRLTQLFDLLNLDAYVEITQQEGISDFPLLAESFLGHLPDPVMMAQIDAVYDPARLSETVRQAMEAALTPDEVAAALIFMDSATGEKIASLELAARRAMSDPDIEEAALDAWTRAQAENNPLVAQIEQIKEVSDLVDRNVTGALNSNLRFMQGLADGSGLDSPQGDLLADIWSQEPAIRADTEDWLGAYLMLAFQALTDAEIRDYIAFWDTVPGRALNAAMFDAFNQMYDGVSYATARVLALYMGSQEL